MVKPNTTPQNRIVMWELSPLINIYSGYLSTEVGGEDCPDL